MLACLARKPAAKEPPPDLAVQLASEGLPVMGAQLAAPFPRGLDATVVRGVLD